ncbi:GNAT family N-acetyltransferase [Clostridium folliculivorans]|uniref:GNAT family N-acetyltransferase n=1 Tax=Clostridium folliculivorans TaxID=2886038 RepID=UPI0021C3C728|nr:GNAT family N-acetyltransferase [Clostridium folliculivorans]GKU30186.1 N-acetyltransferase [Clostridium folliculivorans]
MKIREIEKSDAEKYLKLLLNLDKEDNKMATQVYKAQDNIKKLEMEINFINKTNSKLLIVEDSKKFVGYLSIERDIMNRKITGFLHVGLLEKYTNKGIGTKLVEVASDWCKDNDIHTLYLRVRADNTKAIALFKRMGFIIDGTVAEELKETDSEYDELQMLKALKDARVNLKIRSA